jgi:acetolactate synthase I/II/III large subunit
MTTTHEPNVAQLLVECLEHEGVEYIFGVPGEENIHILDALRDSPIRFVLAHSEKVPRLWQTFTGVLPVKRAYA